MPRVEYYDDPIWEFTLNSKLAPYIPAAREFWNNIESVEVNCTGVFPITGESIPPGLMYRVTNTPVRSPIKHIQAFPFVPTAYLNIVGIPGGYNKMIQRVCYDRQFKIDEFTIIEKSNLPSTYHSGPFVAFVPTAMLDNVQVMGKWVYMTLPEMMAIMEGVIPSSIKYKLGKYI